MRIALVTLVALAAPGIATISVAGGKVVRIEKPQPTRVYVPSGTFAMGVSEGAAQEIGTECDLAIQTAAIFPIVGGGGGTLCEFLREELAHMQPRDVYLDAFAIDRDEVTTGDYRRCVAGGGCSLDALIAGDDRYIGADPYPMVNVTWDEARRFCGWRGGRLPTEAEWERAARANDQRAWPWGDASRPNEFNHGKGRAHVIQALDHQGQTPQLGDPDRDDGFELLAPVGSYPWGEGPYGTLDQAGNVAEWTADVWIHNEHEVGYQTSERRAGLVPLPSVNPRRDGAATDKRVVRGGSWRQPAFVSRANVRDPYNFGYDPNGRFSHVGFRCAY